MKSKNLFNRHTYALRLTCFFICLALILISLFSCQKTKSESNVTYEGAKVHVINVGQGDSILIQSGIYNVLVDAGPGSHEESLIEYLNSAGVDRLDCLVLTHPHEDHIGGADRVIESFKIDTVLMPDRVSNSTAFERLLDAIEEHELLVDVPRRGDKFSLGDLNFTVLAPSDGEYDDINNYSIVLKVEYGDTSFMLTGDAESLSENEILREFDRDFLKCDVLKVGHHGSETSNKEAFVRAVAPTYAAVSCGLDNKYGHPHTEVRELLDSMGIEWYRTDYDGSIVFTSNGKSITVDFEDID